MQTYEGLSTKEAQEALEHYGENTLPEKRKGLIKRMASWIGSPVSLMLITAAILSYANGSAADFWIIVVLFFSNFLISLWHEGKADKSIKQLQQNLLLKVKTRRDSSWRLIDSRDTVPGDIVQLAVGTVVPADVVLLDVTNLSVNESVLTGESLPKEKRVQDMAYSGSFVATGQAIGRVVATGKNTNFGKTIALVDSTPRRSTLEKDIISISRFISAVSIIVVIILTVILLSSHAGIGSILTLDLSLLIAGIPVALPTVMSLIISIGVLELAKRKAVVRRLASLEDLSNVDMLLSDKTGTLTENKVLVEKILPFGSFTNEDVLKFSLSAVVDTGINPLNRAVVERAKEEGVSSYRQVQVIPGDSERKRSTATVTDGDEKITISLGAPQVISSLCAMGPKTKADFETVIKEAAESGYGVHAVAINRHSTAEDNMELVGVMYLADRIHNDARGTIAFMNENGISVKMITGDSFEISKRVARDLGLKGEVYRRPIIDTDKTFIQEKLDSIAGFAEVLPKDKYELVQIAKGKHIVAVTGDGVNDLPAVKSADVGFAVSNAVDALKSTADIVLLSSGISVIKDAIVEARKIFIRLYNYSVYRISESLRLIITIAVIGILFKTYPLTPVQIIVLAFLNDIPIVALAFDNVKNSAKPAHVNTKARFALSSVFGSIGIASSLLLLFVMIRFHLPWDVIQTMFFLKLTVSGHMLVYVAHTEERWFRFLPSKQVIVATTLTQLLATLFAFFGIFTTPISVSLILLVWGWSFVWMQLSDLVKLFGKKEAVSAQNSPSLLAETQPLS